MADRYFVGGGSSTNWDAVTPTNWSATDGGANNASVPTAGDDVFLKSAANCVVNTSVSGLNSFDMTGYTGALSGANFIYLAPSSGTVNCKFVSTGAFTWTGTLYAYAGASATINLFSGGRTLNNITFGDAGTVSLQDALATASNCVVSLNKGTLLTNGYGITSYSLRAAGVATRVWNLTNSLITIEDYWDPAIDDSTIISTGSTILMTGADATFVGSNKTYNIVTFSGDNIIISGDNTFTTLNVNTAGLGTGLVFTIDSIQTVTNFATNGSAGNLAKILSTSAGSHFHLTTGSAQISVDYMSIRDSVADEANTWYAGANSTDVSGNSGWVFGAPPTIETTSLNALIKKTISETLTIGALLQQSIPITLNMNAILSIVGIEIVSIDALIKKLGIQSSLSIDALMHKTGTEITGIDAMIQSSGVIFQVNVDALLTKSIAITSDLDALMQKTGAESSDIDAILSKAGAVTSDLDALMQKTGTESSDIDAILSKAGAVTSDLDALMQKTGAESSDIDAMVTKAQTTSAIMDAILFKSLVESLTMDAILYSSRTASAIMDAHILKLQSINTSLDALILSIGLTAEVGLDALIFETTTKIASLDAMLLKGEVSVTTLDSILFERLNYLVDMDALLNKKGTTASFLDAVIWPVLATATAKYHFDFGERASFRLTDTRINFESGSRPSFRYV